MNAQDPMQYPLELSGAQFRQMVDEASARLAGFLDTLPQQPASQLEDAVARARTAAEPLPRRGESFQALLARLFDEVFPVSLNTTGPGYMAYIPGGGLPHAAIADLISLVVNRYVGLWSAAPVVAETEATVVRWLCELLGYPDSSGGFLSSGGSLANWTAMILARETRAREDFSRGVIYTSDQAHHSVAKAAALAGFRREHVRQIQSDDDCRLDVEALQESIRQDRRQDLLPVAVVAQGGTTNTGAVDDLEALANVTAAEHLWLHVDAAYGGFFVLTQRGRDRLRGIARADSVTLDPHKGLFLPYGTGCLLVRRKVDLQGTFPGRGEYMTAAAGSEFTDFCDVSPELSRDFRGLRIWLPMKLHGIEPFRVALDEKLDLAEHAARQLRQIPGIQLVTESQLSIVAFRFHQRGMTTEELNQCNRELLARVNASKRVMLSGTKLRGRFVLRLCILSFRTHLDRVDECLELIRVGAADLVASSERR